MSEIAWRRGDGGPIRDALVLDLARRAGAYARPDPVEGIAIGGCVSAVGTERRGAMRRRAHAHTSAKDAHRGWLCFAGGLHRVLTASGKATSLLRHEVAHLLTWSGHDARWRKAVTDLGAPKEAKRIETRLARRGSTTWYWHDPETGEQRSGTHRQMTEATR